MPARMMPASSAAAAPWVASRSAILTMMLSAAEAVSSVMMLPLALIGAPLIGALLLIFSRVRETADSYLLIVRYTTPEAGKTAEKLAGQAASRCRVRSKTVTGGEGAELILELRLKDSDAAFVQKLSETPGVTYASLVSAEET